MNEENIIFFSPHRNLRLNLPPEKVGYGFSANGEAAPLPDIKFVNGHYTASTKKVRRREPDGKESKELSMVDILRRHTSYGELFEEKPQVDHDLINRLQTAISARVPENFNQDDEADILTLKRYMDNTMRNNEKGFETLSRVVRRFKVSNVRIPNTINDYKDGVKGVRRSVTFVLEILAQQGIIADDSIVNTEQNLGESESMTVEKEVEKEVETLVA